MSIIKRRLFINFKRSKQTYDEFGLSQTSQCYICTNPAGIIFYQVQAKEKKRELLKLKHGASKLESRSH